MADRPERFDLDPNSQLAQGLVFFGGGRHPKTTHYHESSLYGNLGTLTNMEPATDWVWDNFLGRWALDFDGNDDYVSLPTNIAATEYGTIACWVKCDDINAGSPSFVTAKEGTDANSSFQFGAWDGNAGQAYDGTVRLAVKSAATNTICYGTTVLALGTWYHVACGRGAAGYFIFVNGVSESLTFSAGASTDTQWWDDFPLPVDWRLGRHYYNSAWINPLDGQMADIGIWNRALSAAEIQRQADPSNTTLSGLILPPKRRLFAAVVGTPAATIRWPWQQRRHRNMAGVS